MKGVMRFGRKGKLSPMYVGPYEILHRVGEVAYELAFTTELGSVHPVFHVSMLKKCLGDPALILHVEGLGTDEDLSYEEVPVEILDRQVKWRRNEEIVTVTVLWINNHIGGDMWEDESNMRSLTLIILALKARLPTLKSKFPYISIFYFYLLVVHNDFFMI